MKKDKKIIFKILAITIFQSIVYYLVKIWQGNPTLINSALDNNIPFVSYFVYFYVSWYVMLIVVPYIFYKSNHKDFTKYTFLYILSGITANIIYLIFPTTIQRASIIPNTITLQIVDIVYFFDMPVLNCLPSMHCIVSFIFMIISLDSKALTIRSKIIINTLSILVIISTLFIKQHVIYDVVSAFIIVLFYNIIYKLIINYKSKVK